jgi:hypothetical protein
MEIAVICAVLFVFVFVIVALSTNNQNQKVKTNTPVQHENEETMDYWNFDSPANKIEEEALRSNIEKFKQIAQNTNY